MINKYIHYDELITEKTVKLTKLEIKIISK